MQSVSARRLPQLVIALLFLIPALYFITINLLYEMGVNDPYLFAEPLLEKWGLKQPPGWNINGLIVLGPVIAGLLAAWQVLHIEIMFSRQQWQIGIIIHKKWFPLLILFGSIGVLVVMLIYGLRENFA